MRRCVGEIWQMCTSIFEERQAPLKAPVTRACAGHIGMCVVCDAQVAGHELVTRLMSHIWEDRQPRGWLCYCMILTLERG